MINTAVKIALSLPYIRTYVQRSTLLYSTPLHSTPRAYEHRESGERGLGMGASGVANKVG